MNVRTHNLTFLHSLRQLVGSIQTVNESKLATYRHYFVHGVIKGSQPDLGIQDMPNEPRFPFFGLTPFYASMPPMDHKTEANLMDMDDLVIQHRKRKRRKHG